MDKRLDTIDLICSQYDTLSDSEKRVAEYIIQQPEEALLSSVRDIAKASETSGATVSRFVRHIGCDSFSVLRLRLATELKDNSRDSDGLSNSISLDDIDSSLKFILTNKIDEITGTCSQLSAQRIEEVVELIIHSDTVFFAACGNSIPICSNFAFKLGQIGIRTVCPTTTEAMILTSLSFKCDDLVIIVSSSGKSNRLETIIDNAEDSDTKVVMITANPDSYLAKRADVVLTMITRDRVLTGEQFATHLCADFIVDVLFLFVLESDIYAREHARLERKILGRDKTKTPSFY